MKEVLTNQQMHQRIDALTPLLQHRNLIGYAAARNVRLLKEAAAEYLEIFQNAIMSHGEKTVDEETGRVSYTLPSSDEGLVALEAELHKYCDITHEVNTFVVPINEALGVLSGEEILRVDFMLDESSVV